MKRLDQDAEVTKTTLTTNAQPFLISKAMVQLISLDDMKRFIAIDVSPTADPGVHCQRLLRGWMKFVAPLTPNNLDGIPHLKCARDRKSVV